MNDIKFTVQKSKVFTYFLTFSSIMILIIFLYMVFGLLYEGISKNDLFDFIIFVITLSLFTFYIVIESIKHLFSPKNIITIYNNEMIKINSFKIKETISVNDIDKVKVGLVEFTTYIRIYLKDNKKIKFCYSFKSKTIEQLEQYLHERNLIKY